jgi:hypothetical protein
LEREGGYGTRIKIISDSILPLSFKERGPGGELNGRGAALPVIKAN